MGSLIFQCLAILITAFISINSLKKDLTSSNRHTKRIAKFNRILIIVFTLASIVATIWTFLDNESDKIILNKSILSITNTNKEIRKENLEIGKQNLKISSQNILISSKNDSLRNILNQNSIITSQLITNNQIKSTKQLTSAARKLKDLISGSIIVPKFEFTLSSEPVIGGRLVNTDNKPIYNLFVNIVNFENLEKCKAATFGKLAFIVDEDCFHTNNIDYGLNPIIRANSELLLKLPLCKPNSLFGKYILFVNFNSRNYIEEAVYKTNKEIIITSAVRILEIKNSAIISTTLVKKNNPGWREFDWNKEFPEKYIKPFKILKFTK